MKLVFEQMKLRNITYADVERGSSIKRTAIKAWRHKNAPGLESIESVLGFLGYDFLPVPRVRILPPTIQAELASISERHGIDIQTVAQALIEVTSGMHDRAVPA